MTAGFLAALAILSESNPSGDVVMRLWRRFPSCEGTLLGQYAGDEYAFLNRVTCPAGELDLTVLLEKDRGESWVDMAACGADWAPQGSALSASAGWLDCRLGSGLLLDRGGGWGSAAGFAEAKAPSTGDRIAAATSAGACDGEPLTGAGGALSLDRFEIGLVAGISSVDPAGEGLHRTDSELDAKASVQERIAGAHGSWGLFGAGAVIAERDGAGWGRYGLDLQVPLGGCILGGEAVLGTAGDSSSVAFWTALSGVGETARSCISLFACPGGFPSQRSGMPLGGECDLGAGAGLRWSPARGWTLSGSASCLYEEGAGGLRFEAGLGRRISSSLDTGLSGRYSEDGGDGSWRLVGDAGWEVEDAVRLSAVLQGSGWRGPDSSGTGSAAELRLTWSATGWLDIRTACAAFGTDDWGSRVYCNELGFPGEFASTAQWGDGFLLQLAPCIRPGGGAEIRLRLSELRREGVASIGTGLEETEGASRTEAGVQLDFPL